MGLANVRIGSFRAARLSSRVRFRWTIDLDTRLRTGRPFDSSSRYGECGRLLSRGSKEKDRGSPIFSRAKSGWREFSR